MFSQRNFRLVCSSLRSPSARGGFWIRQASTGSRRPTSFKGAPAPFVPFETEWNPEDFVEVKQRRPPPPPTPRPEQRPAKPEGAPFSQKTRDERPKAPRAPYNPERRKAELARMEEKLSKKISSVDRSRAFQELRRTLLKAIEKSNAETAFTTYDQLISDSFHLDPETYLELIKLTARSGHIKRAWKMYQSMKKEGIKPNLDCFTHMMTACSESPVIGGKASDNGQSQSQPTAVSGKTVMEIANKLLFEDMPRWDVKPSLFIYNAFLKACFNVGDVVSATKALTNLQSAAPAVLPDAITYTTMIAICGKAGDIQKACDVFDQMKADTKERKKQPHGEDFKLDAVAYNTLMIACRSGPNPRQAFDVFHQMVESSVKPSLETMSILLGACRIAKEYKLAEFVLEQVQRFSLAADSLFFSNALRALCLADLPVRAHTLFTELVQLSNARFARKAPGAAQSQEPVPRQRAAWALTEPFRPDQETLNLLAARCVKLAEADLCLDVFSHMKKNGMAVELERMLFAITSGTISDHQKIAAVLNALKEDFGQTVDKKAVHLIRSALQKRGKEEEARALGAAFSAL